MTHRLHLVDAPAPRPARPARQRETAGTIAMGLFVALLLTGNLIALVVGWATLIGRLAGADLP